MRAGAVDLLHRMLKSTVWVHASAEFPEAAGGLTRVIIIPKGGRRDHGAPGITDKG